MIDVKGMAPLLSVFDMPAAVHFYRDVLGFEVVTTSHPPSQLVDNYGWALLRLKGVELMLNTAYDEGERPPTPDVSRVSAHNDMTLYFGCEDLDAVYQHLRAHGLIVNEPSVANYGMRQLYVNDPDGYGLCFQWPASQQSKDQWKARYGVESKA
jgi:uncharacterized glyoxalase superfamily protein PhnB